MGLSKFTVAPAFFNLLDEWVRPVSKGDWIKIFSVFLCHVKSFVIMSWLSFQTKINYKEETKYLVR
jgi:hypothetical protein